MKKNKTKKRYREGQVLVCIMLCFLTTVFGAYGRQFDGNHFNRIAVSGRVVDEEGKGLPSVTIEEKGTANRAVTAVDGTFKLLVSGESAVLLFSSVGYIRLETIVGKRTQLDIIMKRAVTEAEEVVVVGYGTMRKADLTGSISSVDASTLTQSNLNSLEGALQGRVAGVSISAQSGEPGAASDVKIRGANSINASSSPLYVIDGVLIDVNVGEVASSTVGGSTSYSPLATLNPREIESVEVLKDASATAIYGARGANGVIIVTTKGGKMGDVKTTVNLNAYTGISEPTKSIDMIGGQEYVDYRHLREPLNTAWGVDTDDDGVIDAVKDVSDMKSYNWQKELFRKGSQNNVNLSAQGGSKNTSWSGGTGYLNQKGLVQNNDYASYFTRLKLDQRISPKTKIGMNFNWGKTITEGVASSGGGAENWNGLVQAIYTFRPVLVYDMNAEDEPLSLRSMIDEGYKKTDFNRLITTVNINHEIIKNLQLNVSGGGTFTSSKLSEFYGSNTLWGRLSQGIARLRDTKTESFIQTSTLNYALRPFKRDWANILIGSELTAYTFETFFARSQKFEDESTGVFDMSKGLITEPTISQVSKTNRTSFFGRFNYNLMGKYLFTGTFRADGSSNFGEGNRFAYFPSIALGWNIHKENFLKNVENLSNLKLRLSYGVTGNDRIPAYQGFGQIATTYYSNNGQLVYGVSPVSSANRFLKWEQTTQYNLGLELGLLKDRITLTSDIYLKETTDMLLNAAIASQNGFINQWRNVGSIKNRGVEVTLNTLNVDKKDFSWSTSLNFYLNRNKVTSLGGDSDLPVIFGAGYLTDVGIVKVGQPLGTGYGLIWDGVYQIDDFNWQNNSDPSIPHAQRTYSLKEDVTSIAGVAAQPGLLKYKDLNGDKTINNSDRTIISNSNPKFAAGFSNEFQVHGFFLNLFFQGVYGNQILNGFTTMVESGGGDATANLTQAYWTNRWTPDNPSNRYASTIPTNTDNRASTYYVEDGSFLRFKTLSAGYNLNGNILNKLNLSGLKLYATIDNVFVWNKYSGLDPEVSSLNPLLPGYDRLAYPRARTYMLGLNITF